MSDNFTTVIFIIIAVVVFVGRTILEARKRKNAPPRKTGEAAHHEEAHQEDDYQSLGERIGPVHFEIEEEKKKKLAALAAARKATVVKTNLIPKEDQGLPAVSRGTVPIAGSSAALSRNVQPQAAAQGPGLHLNLSKLSPLKQAVVMAEILGPPKGLS